MILEIATGIAIGTPIGLLVRKAVAGRERARVGQRFYAARFFELAGKLVSSGEIDDETSKKLEGYATLLDRRATFFVVSAAIHRADKEWVNRQHRSFTQPDQARLDYFIAFHSWLMAVTYSRPLLGIWVRAKLAKFLDPDYVTSGEKVIEENLCIPLAHCAA